jgi:hypothetical protein
MYNWEFGPEEDNDAWEERVHEEYEEYVDSLKEDDYVMSFEDFMNKMVADASDLLYVDDCDQEEVC